MQKLCCVCTRQHPLPVWSHKFVISSLTHFSINSHPFLVGIVSEQVIQDTYKVTSRFGGTIPHSDYLRNTSSQETLFSIYSGEMSLLPQTPYSVIHQLSMMEVQWNDSLLEKILWYVMPMESKVRNNLSTHFMIISSPREL